MRKLGILLAMIGLLVTSSVALAAGPASPIQIEFVNVSNISINGVPGTQLVVAPGTDVSLTATVADSHPNSCPGCIDFFPVAFQGAPQPAGCLENYGRTGDTVTNTVYLGTAPLTPGAYNIIGEARQVYYCSQNWNPNVGTVIAQIVVPPTDKDQCKHGGWMNFGGIFKNQGDCVSYVATDGKNPPSGD